MHLHSSVVSRSAMAKPNTKEVT